MFLSENNRQNLSVFERKPLSLSSCRSVTLIAPSVCFPVFSASATQLPVTQQLSSGVRSVPHRGVCVCLAIFSVMQAFLGYCWRATRAPGHSSAQAPRAADCSPPPQKKEKEKKKGKKEICQNLEKGVSKIRKILKIKAAQRMQIL